MSCKQPPHRNAPENDIFFLPHTTGTGNPIEYIISQLIMVAYQMSIEKMHAGIVDGCRDQYEHRPSQQEHR
ncbi:hypothetical protein BOTNAR_0028g00110 [Botryotinia narcissicola]|uniref:Uncharacterized protein n=1 Tax=Botryotinia narcissicola TaxID=278944 RepID=A0A4Z1J3B9_9HELO|nr:hypothetical protein BOTNAR_0028g00110 [Botryotinia narcissicola]